MCAPRQCNVGLLAYSPLSGGALTGKYIKGNDPKARFNLFPGQPSSTAGAGLDAAISPLHCKRQIFAVSMPLMPLH